MLNVAPRWSRNFSGSRSSPTRPAPCGAALPASRSSSRCATASRCRPAAVRRGAAGQLTAALQEQRRVRGAAGAVGASGGLARPRAPWLALAELTNVSGGGAAARRRCGRAAAAFGHGCCESRARARRGGWGRCARHRGVHRRRVALPRQLQRARRVPPRLARARRASLAGVRGGGAAAGVPRPDVLGEGVVRQRQVRLQGGAAGPSCETRRRPPLSRRRRRARLVCAARVCRAGVCVCLRGCAAPRATEVRPRPRRDAVEARRLRGREAARRPGWSGKCCEVPLLCKCPCAHGDCVEGQCKCADGWSGECCEVKLCPDNCCGLGRCVDGYCECDAVTLHGEHIQLSGKSCTEGRTSHGAICAGCAALSTAAPAGTKCVDVTCASGFTIGPTVRVGGCDGVACPYPTAPAKCAIDGATDGGKKSKASAIRAPRAGEDRGASASAAPWRSTTLSARR